MTHWTHYLHEVGAPVKRLGDAVEETQRKLAEARRLIADLEAELMELERAATSKALELWTTEEVYAAMKAAGVAGQGRGGQ